MESTKGNTLYLPIKQVYFDAIIAGTKKEEYREVKDTTYKKHLKCDPEGYLVLRENTPEDFTDDIMAYNKRRFPYEPIEYKYLYLAVGYSKERDTALIEVTGITFEPAKDKEGKEYRCFWEEKEGLRIDPEGDLTIWMIVYHLGKVTEVKRKS